MPATFWALSVTGLLVSSVAVAALTNIELPEAVPAETTPVRVGQEVYLVVYVTEKVDVLRPPLAAVPNWDLAEADAVTIRETLFETSDVAAAVSAVDPSGSIACDAGVATQEPQGLVRNKGPATPALEVAEAATLGTAGMFSASAELRHR